MKEREYTIDLARVISTFLVMLAHVSIPNNIREIRSFDVILLIFISGRCINYKNYFHYLLKRFKRLVVPTWGLLIVLFSITEVVCKILKKGMIYTPLQIVNSFLFFNDGIGYIWIIRIYLGIAIILPFIFYLLKYIRNDAIKILIIYVFLVVLAYLKIDIKNLSFKYYIYEILVYTVISSLSYSIFNIENEERRNRLMYLLLLVSLFFTVSLSINGFIPNENKYPPRGLYIFYGIFMSILFFKLLEKIEFKFKKLYFFNIILYISQQSFNLYLIHIIVLSFINLSSKHFCFKFNWFVEYLLVVFISILGVVFIDILKKIITKKLSRRKNEKN